MEERIITTTEDFVEEVIRTDSTKTCGKGGLIALGVTLLVGAAFGGYKLVKNYKAKKTEEVTEDTSDEDIVEDEEDFEEE